MYAILSKLESIEQKFATSSYRGISTHAIASHKVYRGEEDDIHNYSKDIHDYLEDNSLAISRKIVDAAKAIALAKHPQERHKEIKMHFYDYQLHEIDYYDFSIPQVMMDILQKLQEELDENDEIRIRRATPPVPPAPPTRTPYIVLPVVISYHIIRPMPINLKHTALQVKMESSIC